MAQVPNYSYSLTIDARERQLTALFGAGSVQVRTLPVGDVQCDYSDGSTWLMERKTVMDCS